MPYGPESRLHLGWSPRFDQDIFDYAVDAELIRKPAGTVVQHIEDHLQLEIWNEERGRWEDLFIDEYLAAPTGTFHLLRRKGLRVCHGIDVIRNTLKAAGEGVHHLNVPFPTPYLRFHRALPPYRVVREDIHSWCQEGVGSRL